MKQSAIMFALILTALQGAAHADSTGVAGGDESASNPAILLADGPEYGPAVDGNNPVAPSAPTVEVDDAEFQRLLGSAPAASDSAASGERKAIDSVAAAAWPWWSIPLGLLAVGALLVVRGRALNKDMPMEAIHVVSRQPMGKDGSLALIEVHDGDARPRRLLVGLGGGAPRLVADVSAWEVAVAAPANIANDAIAVVGPDPLPESTTNADKRRAQLHVAPASFESQLGQAAARYGANIGNGAATEAAGRSKAELIEDVLAQRDIVRLETVGENGNGRNGRTTSKPGYSSREVLV